MKYLLVTLILIGIIHIYFKMAEKAGISDLPNHRSSHTSVTIRGAGIIFLFSTVLSFFWFKSISIHVFVCISILSILSFIDDIKGLSAKVRLPIQIGTVSVLLLFAFTNIEWYWLMLMIIVASGFLNIYNFMDGINGISTIYTAVFMGTVLYLNQHIGFFDNNFLIITLLGLFVFGFYNVRSKAKCFLGDVGSVTLGIIVIITLSQLMISTKYPGFLLFIAVYVVDGGITIVRRLLRKENIFKAHRSHLYQFLANEGSMSHIKVSFIYGGLQLILNLVVLIDFSYQIVDPLFFTTMTYAIIATLYLVVRKNLKKS